MLIQHNYLSKFRKESKLLQLDLSLLMLVDASYVSRWENGEKFPDLERLLVYNLLFNVPIEYLFERLKHELTGILCERIQLRLEELRNENDEDTGNRIEFLTSAFERLTGTDKSV